MRAAYLDEDGHGPVGVEVLAGMAARPPDSAEPDETQTGEDRYGWYVVCNGRIVLAADKSEVSGWGTDGWPQWHPQYAGFIGIVLFSAEDSTLLPLTTTKRSVDVSSSLYRRVRPRMREAARAWIDYTNARKQALVVAKSMETGAKPRSIFQIAERASLAVPQVTPNPGVKMANINYAMPAKKVRALAQALGNVSLSYRDVGIKAFDRTYGDLVDDE